MISRIEKIMNEQGMTPSLFADTIDINRSTLSHIFSGRNKPSLEIILKIINSFPSVDLYWLLGIKKKEKIEKKILNDHLLDNTDNDKEKIEQESIIIFFKNKTFKKYKPIKK